MATIDEIADELAAKIRTASRVRKSKVITEDMAFAGFKSAIDESIEYAAGLVQKGTDAPASEATKRELLIEVDRRLGLPAGTLRGLRTLKEGSAEALIQYDNELWQMWLNTMFQG